jgi:cell division septation protein DedD
VQAVAIVIDDALGGDAAAKVSMRLLDAERVPAADGEPRPPELLVDGVRSILIYAVRTTGPAPGVVVDGCGGGQLAGVLGIGGSVSGLAETFGELGVEAAVAPPLVGGSGVRGVRYVLADGPVDKTPTKRVPAKKTAAKQPAKKAPAKKTAAKTAAATKTSAKKAVPAKKAVAKKAVPARKVAAKKAVPAKKPAKKAVPAKKPAAKTVPARKPAKKPATKAPRKRRT